jgi:hypothetical protein
MTARLLGAPLSFLGDAEHGYAARTWRFNHPGFV